MGVDCPGYVWGSRRGKSRMVKCEEFRYLIGVSRGSARGGVRTALARGSLKRWVRGRIALAIG